MDTITIVREIGRKRAANQFYRTCHFLLQELRRRVLDINDELILLQCEPLCTPITLHAMRNLSHALEKAVDEGLRTESIALETLESLQPKSST
ncbi:hypothetical protein N7533_008311 [Penicillium manginii]|jgi:hypothetical protein|uniref:uncharacterized protein n=1 Tax=Penicillium manginii TaxID=203109 RepID=UPI002548BE8D|nr:uncharacterized protein N7533_008311 [Penicillium manginii]KAJ5751283.1 hypothetical protein N7533_008311 [Penicillium manginii]